jgi:hypothetical protein
MDHEMIGRFVKSIAVLLAGAALLPAYAAADYLVFQKSAYEDALDKINHIRGAETCQSIPASTYESFLIFNPSNLQTYYFRSYCYQRVAVDTRDESLCDQVKERKALFLDGSGISPAACRKAVGEIRSKDFAERVRPESVHKIQRVEITTAPSRDIELRVTPVGSLWGSYRFSVTLLDGSGRDVGVLSDIETHLSDRNDVLFASLQRRKIEALMGAQNGCGKAASVRIGLTLLRDDAGQLKRSSLSTQQIESTATEALPVKSTQPADCR